MTKKIVLAASLMLAFAGAVQAQAITCTCDATAARQDSPTLAGLLTNKMVCGSVGGEVWQELHSGGATGQLRDYKKGPSDPVDPSTPVGSSVGSYTVNTDNTVTYSYPGQPPYKYEVCLASGGAGYLFCGVPYGGRNIPGVRIGGSGLTSCSAVSNTLQLSTRDVRTKK